MSVFKKWDDDMNTKDVTNPWHRIPAIFEWYFHPLFEQRRIPSTELRIGIASRISFEYVNYKGVTSVRRVFVVYYAYGSTIYHPVPQWLMHGFDIDKQAERTFAMNDMHNVVDI